MTTSSGALLVDKPAGLTSHDVVARCRRLLGERRIGHAGTLDPMATGLLVMAVGPSTRLLRFAQAQTKRYTGTVRWGVATDSLDADGTVVATQEVRDLSASEVATAAATMEGEQLQTPPMVSALKVGGRRLHALAREGIDVERAPRAITIQSFTLTPTDDPLVWQFDVTCSVGTYVRVLLADLAGSLGTIGHLTSLRRESSGTHRVAEAFSLDQLSEMDDVRDVLRPPRDLVAGLEFVELDAAQVARVRQGQRVSFEGLAQGSEVAALDTAGQLVGVLSRRGDQWKPDIVLPAHEGAA